MEKAGRNDPCPCGSGLKYKQCCWGKPTKIKFKAKVIKSGSQDEGEGKLNFDPNFAEFKMTEKDFRISTEK